MTAHEEKTYKKETPRDEKTVQSSDAMQNEFVTPLSPPRRLALGEKSNSTLSTERTEATPDDEKIPMQWRSVIVFSIITLVVGLLAKPIYDGYNSQLKLQMPANLRGFGSYTWPSGVNPCDDDEPGTPRTWPDQDVAPAFITEHMDYEYELIDPSIHLYLVKNVISPDIMAQIKELAMQSGGFTSSASSGAIDKSVRSSDTYQHPLSSYHPAVLEVDRLVSKLIGIPMNRLEELNIVRYHKDGFFTEHSDLLVAESHNGFLATSGQRSWTVVVYMNEPEEGGHTSFKSGKSVKPVAGGMAIWFNKQEKYDNPNEMGGQGWRNLQQIYHTGDRVIKGEKWIINYFTRHKNYRCPSKRLVNPSDYMTACQTIHVHDPLKLIQSGMFRRMTVLDPEVRDNDLLLHKEHYKDAHKVFSTVYDEQNDKTLLEDDEKSVYSNLDRNIEGVYLNQTFTETFTFNKHPVYKRISVDEGHELENMPAVRNIQIQEEAYFDRATGLEVEVKTSADVYSPAFKNYDKRMIAKTVTRTHLPCATDYLAYDAAQGRWYFPTRTPTESGYWRNDGPCGYLPFRNSHYQDIGYEKFVMIYDHDKRQWVKDAGLKLVCMKHKGSPYI